MQAVLLAGATLIISLSFLHGQQQTVASQGTAQSAPEIHLRNIRQITFGGENAEAYFSADDRWLIFQSHSGEGTCDQIYIMDTDGKNRRMVSTGKGRTTCGYFFPDGKRVVYSSTHIDLPGCPPRPDYSKGYVWQVHEEYDIFTAKPDGSDLKRLTTTTGYDAEATISRDGRIVFTSQRDGDLDIYTMALDGKNVKRLTNEVGYDGGPSWSPDGKRIVYRAHHPSEPAEIEDFRSMLNNGLVRPLLMDLYLMDADGRNKRQVTHLAGASFAPYVLPDGKRIIFSSNYQNPRGPDFELYLINTDGTRLEQVTFSGGFTAFPMFSHDGKRLVFVSDRNAKQRGEFNVFIADWVD
ncbi:MAG: PD40 domain-containing protein [Acidobacteria bacterium]|nr:PD40 domain-containing protein [Acidobacteriota bacterium]